jgi:hypothetical protein
LIFFNAPVAHTGAGSGEALGTGATRGIHCSLNDPAAAGGSAEHTMMVFRASRDAVRECAKALITESLEQPNRTGVDR